MSGAKATEHSADRPSCSRCLRPTNGWPTTNTRRFTVVRDEDDSTHWLLALRVGLGLVVFVSHQVYSACSIC